MLVAPCPSQIWVQWGQCSRQSGGPHRLLHAERDEAGFCQQARAGRLHQGLQEGINLSTSRHSSLSPFYLTIVPKIMCHCRSITAENVSGKKWNICVHIIIQPATRGRQKYWLFCWELLFNCCYFDFFYDKGGYTKNKGIDSGFLFFANTKISD